MIEPETREEDSNAVDGRGVEPKARWMNVGSMKC
jgi:hypothetical protein